MVNKEVVLETIKKMYDSGIEDSVVEATLKDIGLKEGEIKQYMVEVKGKPVAPAQAPEREREAIAEKAAEKIKTHLVEEKEERELKETTQQVAIEGHREHLETVEQKVGQLHEKVESLATPSNSSLDSKLSVLENRINSIEAQLTDLKALGNATKSLMEKVLEVNRNILNKL